MNITQTSLEALILKATHESLPYPDAAALEAFCAIMQDSPEGPMMAAHALGARIHAPIPREALLALTMIDLCMRRCDAAFHAEIGKFRFLNEMIKLVSPKYYADRTASEVQIRVVQLLHAWAIEYPKEHKFRVAYDMLRNQGVVTETPPPLPADDTPIPRERAKNAIFEDEEKSKLLQKLLQSKKPEDLQHANRLIKTMVREEERRSEASSRRAAEVSAALDSAELLRDMLSRAADASPDEHQLIHELRASCARLRPVLQRLAAEDHQESLGDILHASDVLDDVFKEYNKFMSEKKETPPIKPEPKSSSLLDFAGTSVEVGKGDAANKETENKNTIDELGDIFCTEGASANIVEPLKPVNLMPNDDVDLLGQGQKNNKAEGWNELDSLGEQLLKQSLPDNAKRLESFNSKPTKKIPMNALEKMSPNHVIPKKSDDAMLDLDFFTNKPVERKAPTKPERMKVISPTDDIMVDISTNETPTAAAASNSNTSPAVESPLDKMLDLSLPLDCNNRCDNETPLDSKDTNSLRGDSVKKGGDVRPLGDINVSLQSVRPSAVAPVTAFEEEDGVTVVLHFCKDKPRPDVNVVVVSTTSKCSSPIEDYKFQAVVPKGCKVRLLAASGGSLPARNPFLPPPALTQVMLVGRPTAAPLTLKFVITYSRDDDTCTELGEVELPLDDI